MGHSLERVQGLGQETLLIDSGSTDDTLVIAASHGVQILVHPWEGFAKQRLWALSQARHDWILMIDSDECLTPRARSVIQKILSEGPRFAAYTLSRRSYVGSKPIHFGDWRHDEVLRLFDRRLGHYNPHDTVHEAWQTSGNVGRIPGLALEHYSYSSLQQLWEKAQQYTQLNAQKVAARGRPISSWTPMSHALWAFFRCYLLRLGFLDGVEGGAIAWTTALGAYFKYALAREMLTARQRDSS